MFKRTGLSVAIAALVALAACSSSDNGSSDPAAGETGWKDTVQAYQRSVTRIIMRFEGYTGRYLWHCHIMEHAGNDMMRPLEVLPPRKI